ncbi:disabled homolog 2 [Fundulus heteroclitus]|uniref:disabled homolog 2 n=1 Tax=Fundulus heteroclitus TaxID=8078 RepID=UPI00165CC140|nr:disabled homolog 2 [Fundulus heteroclitus]
MTETEQTAAGCPAPGQTAIRTWPPYRTTGPFSDTRSRFEGDGVRYKAKLIGVDPVPQAQGEKMCLDSMMKLKGFEAAARKQGKHKMRIWLKISSSGLKILDERTGIVLHDQDRTRISSLTKDMSDPRALAYIYKHEDVFVLFYIKTANQADPILLDIMEVCQRVDQETSRQPTKTQDVSLVGLNDGSASLVTGVSLVGLDDGSASLVTEATNGNIFSPPPDSSSGHTNQTSSCNELMEIFSPSPREPLSPDNISSVSQPVFPAESPQPTLSTAQILSMFPTSPPGGSPYVSPPLSPSAMPWGQQGPLGTQWTGSWPPTPAVPPGVTAPPAVVQTQPGFMFTMSPAAPPSFNDYPNPLNAVSSPNGTTVAPGAPALDNNPFL